MSCPRRRPFDFDVAAFEKAVAQAAEQAQEGNLVVFGIRPTAQRQAMAIWRSPLRVMSRALEKALLKSLTAPLPKLSRRGALLLE